MDGQAEQHLVPRRSRRFAAMVALAAPVLAVAAVAESGTQHFGNLVVLLVAVAVATVAVWYGLTRRGVLRLLAAVVAAVAGTIVADRPVAVPAAGGAVGGVRAGRAIRARP
ncbi:MAG TPA: hypothetical protein VFH03_24585, partial [Actinoplanes sp.]|nr:hypothetical protein [Actinoplanes sp.]